MITVRYSIGWYVGEQWIELGTDDLYGPAVRFRDRLNKDQSFGKAQVMRITTTKEIVGNL